MNSLLRTLLGLAIVTIVSAGGWVGYQAYFAGKWALQQAEDQLAQQTAQVKDLTRQIDVQQRQIQLLQTANRLLKVDRRVARIQVVSQSGSAANDDLVTKFTFVEVGPDNQNLEQPRTFTIRGDVVYIDAWVIKFDDKLVESADDPLRSASICLFRRIFGEFQQPKDGFALDPAGASPAAYRSGAKMTDVEREIWAHFWDYANDMARAGRAGIRAAHGEAPSIKLVPGKRYLLSLRASGGLEIVAEDVPTTKAG
jgi:hypothetical protein